jgi:serine phosphatase RsbU (regulator of sigma subunit)/tetratricopeptide (TPR) repeat protein
VLEQADIGIPTKIADFEVKGILGRGASAVVYRGARSGQEYAIKVMLPHADVATATRFRREAAVLARIEHEALTRLIEAGEWQGRPFLVSEIARGSTLSAALREGPLSGDRLRVLALSISSGLGELHRRGLVHRDVKPDNVLVSPDGRAKIIDFGLVVEVGTEFAAGEFIGTPAYASPEQTGLLRRPIDGRADLYSLGVMLFEAAVGRRPFEATSAVELLQLHVKATPPDAHVVDPRVRPAFSAIVKKLMAKDPDDRYQSGEGLFADIERMSAIDASLGAGEDPGLGEREAPRRSSEVPLVGRIPELTRLSGRMERALKGQGFMALVEGESGLGKTRLCEETLRVANDAAVPVLSGKATQHDRVPYGPLRDAIEGFALELRRVSAPERERRTKAIVNAAGSFGAIVRRLSRALDPILANAPPVEDLDPDSEQVRFRDTVAGFFPALARELGSAVLAVDDVQWLDQGTLEVLGRVARLAQGAPLLVLTTARNDSASEEARERFVQTVDPKNIDRIVLEPLTAEECGELIRLHLGGRPMPREETRRLRERARGNPFVIGEYLRALLEQGHLRPRADGWEVTAKSLDAVDLPTDVVAVLVQRIAALPESVRRMLGYASVLGFAFQEDDLIEVSGDDRSHVRRSVDAAIRANILELNVDRFAFVHDRVYEATRSQLGSKDSRRAHQRTAEMLARRADDSEASIYAVAFHFANGEVEGNERRVFETALRAGRLALANFSHTEAYAHLERAYGLWEKVGAALIERPAIEELLGIACHETGRPERAHEHLQVALKHCSDPLARARLHLLMCRNFKGQGAYEDAWGHLRSALSDAGAPYPKTRFGEVIGLAVNATVALLGAMTGIGFGRAAKSRRAHLEVQSLIYGEALFLTYYLGDVIRQVSCTFRSLRVAHAIGVSRETARAYAFQSILHGVFGFVGQADRYRKKALAMAEQIGDMSTLANCIMYGWGGIDIGGDARGFPTLVQQLPFLEKHATVYDFTTAYGHMSNQLRFHGRYRGILDFLSVTSAGSGQSRFETGQKHGELLIRVVLTAHLYLAYVNLGMYSEAQKMRERLLVMPWQNDVYAGLFFRGFMIESALLLQKWGEIDKAIEDFLAIRFADYHTRYFFILAGYARYEQYLRAVDDNGRKLRLTQLRKMANMVTFGRVDGSGRAVTPVHTCHRDVLRALVAIEEGRLRRADRLLQSATRLAGHSASLNGDYWVLRARARLAKVRGDQPQLDKLLDEAVGLCQREGWVSLLALLTDEFPLESQRRRTGSSMGTTVLDQSPTQSNSTEIVRGHSAERAIEALLRVGLAAASTLDPQQQAKAALDALVDVLRAERGLLFLRDDRGELSLVAGRDGQGQDLTGGTGYSTTVVKLAYEKRESMVLAGTDEGLLIGSESAVARDLRSIIAAPLMLRGEPTGVVYLDSTLAKGIFTKDDTALLVAVATQVAIAVDTARAAKREAHSREIEKDLALTSALQTLLLPTAQHIQSERLEILAHYQPASLCSGDWWWHERLADGRSLVLVGDVTGHGAASAMVTALVSGCYRLIRRQAGGAEFDMLALFRALDEHILEMTQGSYSMTLGALLVDENTGDAWFGSAASLPLLVARGRSKMDVIMARSSPLGHPSRDSVFTIVDLNLAPGDRAVLFTDGIVELETNTGRQLGVKSVSRNLQKTVGQSPTEATAALRAYLDDVRGDSPQDDDWTFAIVDRVA